MTRSGDKTMRDLMKFLVSALVVLACGCSKKEETPPPPPVREITQPANDTQAKESIDEFLKAADMAVVKQVSAIPDACLRAFNAADFDENAELADPPEDGNHAKWDKKTSPNSSSKRLIFAGANAGSCFVYFRKGSSVPTYQLQIFRLGPPATIAYHGVDSEHIYSDLSALRKALRKKAFAQTAGPEKF
jgi:hypothetical protein